MWIEKRIHIKLIVIFSLLFMNFQYGAAQDKEQKKAEKSSRSFLKEAERLKNKGDFPGAEASYKKATSADDKNAEAHYNLSHLYKDHDKSGDEMKELFETAKKSKSKDLKHKAFHNLGNLFMDKEDYAQAVNAYKDALRNNPEDEETRYNLAVAKDKLENEPDDESDEDDEDDGSDDNEDDDENSRENEESKDEEESEDEDESQDQDNNQDDENEDEDEDQGQDDEKDQDEDDENEAEGQDDEQDEDDDNQQEGEGQGQPDPDEMTEEQAESLLRAAENLEKDVQKKLNEKKAEKAEKDDPKRKDW